MIWCGHFNAHSTLWGDHENVKVIDDLMESKKNSFWAVMMEHVQE